MMLDPGYIPRASYSERRDSIMELISEGKFDSVNFCLATLTAKPIRSKYDRVSKQLVARFDHYCPWTNNVVGLRNHRLFVIYVLSLGVGLVLWMLLYFGSYPDALPDVSSQTICGIYPDGFCALITYAPSYTALAVWDSFQLVWVTLLAFVQLYNISRGLTTFESINLHRFGRAGTEHFSSLPADHPSSAAARLSAVQSASAESSSPKKCWTPFLRVLGVDQFAISAQDAFVKGARSRDFPTNYGIRHNCMDFWFPNGDYLVLREPPGGYSALGGNPVDYYRLNTYPKRAGSAGYSQV
jgi:palmitoyltransferase